MKYLSDILVALGLPAETDEKTAVSVGYTRFKAGDRTWVDGLEEAAQKELEAAFIAVAQAATAVKVGKDEAAKRMEAAIADAEKAATAAEDAKEKAAEKQIAAVSDFSDRERALGAKSAMARVEKHLATADAPQDWLGGDKNEKHLSPVEKLLRIDNGGIEEIAAFHAWCDRAYGIGVLGCKTYAAPDPKRSKFWRSTEELFSDERKAMYSTGTGVGDEWVPTQWSGTLIEAVRVAAVCANMHPRFTMPSNPFISPLESTDPTVYLQGEATADESAKYLASTGGTAQKTWTARKMAVRMVVSDELSEDSIIAVLPQLQAQIIKAVSEAMDDAMVNGQRTAAIDTGDSPATTNVRYAWDGYRYYASSVTDAAVNCATFSVDNLLKVPGLMGKYSQSLSDLMWVTSIYVRWAKLMALRDAQNNAVVMALDAAPGATPSSGMFGVQVVPTSKVIDQYSAAGIYDASSVSQTIMALVHRPSFVIGDRRELTSERARDIQTGQSILVTTQRVACTNVYSAASNPTVGLAYNIPVA
ncbi:MAG TPA: phage major capsid protein [Thermoleophilia bacterium]|nr:phage major capsid protein [Thermoleophilia bacterium]